MGATSDSLQYEYAAQHFATHHELKTEGNRAYVQWGPLYPIILSLQANHIRSFARWLHLVSISICLILWIRLFASFVNNKWWIAFYGITLVCSTELMLISVFIWSEPLFMALMSLFIYLLHRTYHEKTHWIWSAIFAFFMLLQRNAGIFLFAGISLGLIVTFKTNPFKKKQLFFFMLLSSIGFMCWNFYTMIWQHNHPAQFDYPEGFSIVTNAQHLSQAISRWVMPFTETHPIANISGLFMLVGILYISIKDRHRHSFLTVLATGLMTYLSVWLMIYTSLPDIQRFTAIVYPIFFMLVGYSLWKLSEKFPKVKRLILVSTYLWLLYPISRFILQLMRY
ncbi:MAG: hypothetical protein ACPGJS_15510 [Flammeovirgaceae bacterium]